MSIGSDYNTYNYTAPRQVARKAAGVASKGLGLSEAVTGGGAILGEVAAIEAYHQRTDNKDNSETEKVKRSLLTWMPFLNEAANVIAHLKEEGLGWVLEWVYKESPHKLIEFASKWTIDFFALLSMIANGVQEFHDSLQQGLDTFRASIRALSKGAGFLIFSFIVPGKSIPFTQSFLAKKFPILDKPLGRFFTGTIIGIGSLEIAVRLYDHFVTPLIEKVAVVLRDKFFPPQSEPAVEAY